MVPSTVCLRLGRDRDAFHRHLADREREFAEHWDEADLLDLFQQIGMIPASPSEIPRARHAAPAITSEGSAGHRFSLRAPTHHGAGAGGR